MKNSFMWFIKFHVKYELNGNYRLYAKMENFLNPEPAFFSIISEHTKRPKYAYCPECHRKCSSRKGKSSTKLCSEEEVEFERTINI